MSRAPIVIEVKDSVGAVVPSGSVNVKKRTDGTNATLYNAETGGSTITNPVSVDSLGRMICWVDRGDYNAVVSGTGITTYTIPLDRTPAGDKDMDALWAPLGLDPTVLTNTGSGSTPASPNDGDRFTWAPALTNVVPTDFRYRAASASSYKWEAQGGPGGGFCQSTAQVGNLFVASGTLFNLHTGWDSGNLDLFTVPFSGEYDMEASVVYWENAQASASNFMIGPSFSSATTTPTTDVWTRQGIDTSSPSHLWFRTRVTATAGDIIGVASKHTSTSPTSRIITRAHASLRVVPVRVA